ncbi:geranylgeranyl transferase type-2 subunit alpha [Biomphalaria glabrata]|nr:geranylgeranyl transferase type-2 subunit alpha [Biomphalaria glabrata]KAI8761932.1 geranylgeranyl transferase type-2 subunit alpha-like [Biomphalaria glabrata]
MHGRLKVKSTEEQIEAKKKEREKKLLLYNGAMSKIFLKKQNGELDQEMLLLSGEVLVVNPDVYTLWNFRKETFLELSKCLPGEKLQKLYQSELYFLEACLKKNPKSYGSWHHRCFVMDHMPDPDWKRELELCNQFLQLDERNFHCWDYRRFVVHSAKIPPEEEFEFSLRLINNNFSNYSSWHYRSKLLPILFPDATQPMGVSEDALLKEYELVQNGFFTDPDDQSNWFYHRWLMGRGNQTLNINCFYVSREDNCVLVSFTQHIQIGKKTDLILECNGQTMLGTVWLNPNKTSQPSCLADNLTFPKDCDLKVTLVQGSLELCSSSLHLGENDSSLSGSSVTSVDKSIFSQEMSPLKKDTLLQAMESVLQLMEMESDNKWTVLTVVLLMKALDPDSYFDQIMCYLDKLEDLDGKRIHYYKDLSNS